MSTVEKYLKKLENDVSEQLYDLLIMHLLDVDKKVVHAASEKDNISHFLSILDTALNNLSDNISDYNRLQSFRYMILICNTILRYDKKREDIKELKKRIVENYIQSDEHAEGIIPLNYQINEIRLTYSSDYLTYLIILAVS